MIALGEDTRTRPRVFFTRELHGTNQPAAVLARSGELVSSAASDGRQ
jgi:hypothetical protein